MIWNPVISRLRDGLHLNVDAAVNECIKINNGKIGTVYVKISTRMIENLNKASVIGLEVSSIPFGGGSGAYTSDN